MSIQENKDFPSVSFVCSVHQTDKFFDGMVHSLLNQDYPNFDIVLVDDSGKESNICRNFADHPRVKIIKNAQNLGLTRSLNIGIKNSQSQYIARIDRGDWCSPIRLSAQIKYARENKLDICGSYVQEVDECDTPLKNIIVPLSPVNIAGRLQRYNCLVHSSILMQRQVWEKLGGYDERFVFAQDYDLYLRALAAGFKFSVLDKVLVKRRVYHNSTTRSKRKLQILYATAALIFYYASKGNISLRAITNVMAHASKILIPNRLRMMEKARS